VRRALVLLLLLSACGGGDDLPPLGERDFTQCFGSDESFVRNASLAILGRRPLSEAEVDVYAQLLRAVRERDHNGSPEHGRRVVARALMQSPEYTGRWERHFMERLRVPRVEDQDLRACYGSTRRKADDGSLARAVRAGSPEKTVDGGEFTLRDLLRSSIVADDLTPAYRGHLFALITRPIPAANVPEKEAELARREDFGTTFDAVYLNRDLTCLGCHNSEGSTTDRDDPAEDRFWPLPGLFEKALYGASTGTEARRAHAMFRYDRVVTEGGTLPWGWSYECGSFNPDVDDDSLTGVEASFGKLRGRRATIFGTEAALAHGFEVLRTHGLELGADNSIADPDVAFAYLVAVNIVDGVWSEVTGNSLVIANYFPRNQAARDVLHHLTEKFVASGFSLQALLEEIVVGPYFDRLPPSAGCGKTPYNMPAVHDPWVRSDADPERRQNGPGDGVHALSSRTAAYAAYQALEWPTVGDQDFPTPSECTGSCDGLGGMCQTLQTCCDEYHQYCELHRPQPDSDGLEDERAFESGTGMFLTNAERGFRGLEFQARLEWENRFARCAPPQLLAPMVTEDFIDRLVARAAERSDVTLRELVLALKDRLLSEPIIDAGAEQAALEAMLGAGLDTPAGNQVELEPKLRLACGAMLASPQFLLGGQSRQEAAPIPRLTPDEAAFAAVCTALAARKLPENLTLDCADGRVRIN
jgi:hypothetical protein